MLALFWTKVSPHQEPYMLQWCLGTEPRVSLLQPMECCMECFANRRWPAGAQVAGACQA